MIWAGRAAGHGDKRCTGLTLADITPGNWDTGLFDFSFLGTIPFHLQMRVEPHPIRLVATSGTGIIERGYFCLKNTFLIRIYSICLVNRDKWVYCLR